MSSSTSTSRSSSSSNSVAQTNSLELVGAIVLVPRAILSGSCAGTFPPPPGHFPDPSESWSDCSSEFECASKPSEAVGKGAVVLLPQPHPPLSRSTKLVWSCLDCFGVAFTLLLASVILCTSWCARVFCAPFRRREYKDTEYTTANGKVYELPAVPLLLALHNIPKAEDVPGVAYGARRRKAGRADMVGGAARAVKATLGGTPERTGANQLMVNTMLLKWLRGQGIRDTDAMGYLPYAIELVFTKTVEEIDASAWSTSRDVAAYHQKVYPCGGWWARYSSRRACPLPTK